MLAALSGTISGILIGGTEVYLRLVVLNGDESRSLIDDPWLWAAFYAGVGVLTVIEIAFLYWNALRAITRIGGVVGVSMKSGSGSNLLATGLARSALEMPNPQTEIYGIDPYALMPRWRLLIQNLLYKAKVGATSFVLRILLRRIFARAVLRGYIPLLAIPLYAIWNAVITWRVMREARLRACPLRGRPDCPPHRNGTPRSFAECAPHIASWRRRDRASRQRCASKLCSPPVASAGRPGL